MLVQKLCKDARYFQILFQAIFLFYGILFLHWEASWLLYCTYFATSIITQLVFEYFLGKKQFNYYQRIEFSFPSIIISSFGLSLLLKTNDYTIAALAAFISIASKYLIKINGKHIFNPSALGIVATILLTGKAWFSPGQWGSSAIILFGVCCFGFIVVTKIQKLDTSLAFLITYVVLIFARQIIYLGWPIDYFIQSISTGSLLLFSFFMITDPKTIPNNKWARVIWSAAIAMVAFYLSSFKFINGAPVYVLIFAQPIVPLLDKIFKAKKFEWKPLVNYQKRKNYKKYAINLSIQQ